MLDDINAAAGHDILTRHRLGMQHLGPCGLSEPWLLAACGDLHWGMIANAFGQDAPGFRATDGRPLYAAFCATRMELAAAGGLLGGELCIRSSITELGGARIGSRHLFLGGGQVLGRLLMLSAFVTHDQTGSNRRIVRARPDRNVAFPAAGPELTALDARARQASRTLRERRMSGRGNHRIVPCPAMDFNAVGLLYFPSFTRLAERAAAGLPPVRMRELVYLGNLDVGEAVDLLREGDETLIARSDGRIIARAVDER